MIEDRHKNKIIALVSGLFPQAKIYLFGSQARGTQSSGSDIDLAIDNNAKIDIVEIGEVRDILNATNIPYKIDVVDFQSVYAEMQQMIIHEGVLWKS